MRRCFFAPRLSHPCSEAGCFHAHNVEGATLLANLSGTFRASTQFSACVRAFTSRSTSRVQRLRRWSLQVVLSVGPSFTCRRPAPVLESLLYLLESPL